MNLRPNCQKGASVRLSKCGRNPFPYMHAGARWERWPSPCVPFGHEHCSAEESARRKRAYLEWVDHQLAPLLDRFRD